MWKALTRTVLPDVGFTHQIGLNGQTHIIEWIVRHTTWLMDRFRKACMTVQYDRQCNDTFIKGIWVGRPEGTDCQREMTEYEMKKIEDRPTTTGRSLSSFADVPEVGRE